MRIIVIQFGPKSWIMSNDNSSHFVLNGRDWSFVFWSGDVSNLQKCKSESTINETIFADRGTWSRPVPLFYKGKVDT